MHESESEDSSQPARYHSKVKAMLFLLQRQLQEQEPSTHGADGNQQLSRALAILPSAANPREKERDVAGLQAALS